MIRATLFAIALLCAPLSAQADAALTRLYDLLELDAYLDITRIEGLEDADELSQDMLGRPADPGFVEFVSRLYDPTRMRDAVFAVLEDTLSDSDIDAALIFFESTTGARITELEVAARRAIMDPALEEATRRAWFLAEEEQPWLVARISEIIEANDLIERNVAGALNANLRFYQGLAEGGAFDLEEGEMLADVWGQEEEIRADTIGWMGGYLLLAYEPLEEQDFTDYLGFWTTQTGRALNGAVFEAFNLLYDDISHGLGRIIALEMGTQEL